MNRILRILKKLKGYSGAGILLTSFYDGYLWVFLGKRRFNPGRATWSIPGGHKERQDADLISTAIREFKEEIDYIDLTEFDFKNIKSVFSFFSGFFNWQTFNMHINNKLLSNYKIGRHHEFSELKWFRIDELPATLHWGVKSAVKNANKKLCKGFNK